MPEFKILLLKISAIFLTLVCGVHFIGIGNKYLACGALFIGVAFLNIFPDYLRRKNDTEFFIAQTVGLACSTPVGAYCLHLLFQGKLFWAAITAYLTLSIYGLFSLPVAKYFDRKRST
jgi:hypothetical protein